MIYTFEITTGRNDDFKRVYHIHADNTLYDLRRLIENDLGFDDSQSGIFTVLGKNGKAKVKYSLFDFGNGAMDTVTLESINGEGTLLYTFDLYNNRSLKIEFLGEAQREARKSYPLIAESTGEAPGQFEETPIPTKLPAIPSDENKKSRKNAAKIDDDDDDFDDDDEYDEPENEDDYDEDELSMFDTKDEI
jgi:hypothetical protein